MGDVAMTVPIIRLVIEQYPKVKISILTKPAYIEIFREFAQANIIALDQKKHKGALGLIKLLNELKALDIDSIIDLHNVLRTKFLKILWGKNFYQIEKGRSEKNQLVNGKIFYQLKSTHQRYLETFNSLGLSLSFSYHKFPQKKDRNKLKLISNGHPNKIIGIAPFAKHKAKTYSIEKTIMLIKKLSENNTILLFGGGEEEIAKLDEITKNNKNTINLARDLSFSSQLDYISNLDLMISMDSANGHLAAMYGVKVLTIWGVTHPYAGFTPFNQPITNSITVNRNKFPKVPTSIYGDKCPNDYLKAIDSIDVEDIYKRAEEIC
tara:strand:+ start:79 stop:1044 length:966 start_codon:yes stop_codon:yes gene_type:complete